MKHKFTALLLPSALLAAQPQTAIGQTTLPAVEVNSDSTPVGSPGYPETITDTRELDKQRPAYTLPQVLEGQTGLIAEGVFGGIDHPRLSIRGSGLQRGTQPAGRGIEIREQGLPLGYADGSFDFVESIDPLSFDEVRVLRSGRAVVNGLYKAEVIHRRGAWKTIESVELATLEWVAWFNHYRLMEPLGYIPPAEAEMIYYQQIGQQAEQTCT